MPGAAVPEMSEDGGRRALEKVPPMHRREGAVDYIVGTSDTRDDAS